MPRMLTRAGILVALLVAPALALAAYDTVSLGTNTAISVGGVSVDIHGSAAVIESLVVNNDSTFSFTLQSGSSIVLSATNLNVLTPDITTDLTASTCNGSESTLTFVGTAARTVTITPSATLCQTTGGGGGGGGGGGTVTTTPTTSTTETTTPVTTETTPTATPAAESTPAATTSSPASGLSSEQVTSILSLLASFGADTATIANVQAALSGGATTGSVTSAAVHAFKADLQLGSLGAEVKALQQFLNAHGYTVAKSGAGSPGNETTKFGALTKEALIKYQKAKGITPAAGYFGPKTRAAVSAE